MTKAYMLEDVLAEALRIAAEDYRGMGNSDIPAQVEEWKKRAESNVKPISEVPSVVPFKGKIWVRHRKRGTTERGGLRKSKAYSNKEWFERMWLRRCREADKYNASSGYGYCYEVFVLAFEMDANGKWIETRRYEGVWEPPPKPQRPPIRIIKEGKDKPEGD